MTAARNGVCHVCGTVVPLTEGGTCGAHRNYGALRASGASAPWCAGEGYRGELVALPPRLLRWPFVIWVLLCLALIVAALDAHGFPQEVPGVHPAPPAVVLPGNPGDDGLPARSDPP